ncbi:hypothetical protein H072_878 [Dactylellina haptotyla CBS 200.50]|uniref:ER membrane protein complex subunit 6 n=1 Tax=Dactylellina haptotyla (strain CBS 200.50) TaxID=1284197 RepID=S8AVT6_DACHA|nr:hypothetical protein H072_878 [Dactylellina haptotyla CBS 200.50]
MSLAPSRNATATPPSGSTKHHDNLISSHRSSKTRILVLVPPYNHPILDLYTFTMNAEERDLQLNPIVPENVVANSKTIIDLHSLSSSLLGIAAGILGLESYSGFLFYLLGTLFVSFLIITFPMGGKPNTYVRGGWKDVVLADVTGGVMGYVLTWTLFFGLVRV